MKPTTAPLSTPGAALLDESPFSIVAWGKGVLRLHHYGHMLQLDASTAKALGERLNELMPPESSIQGIITKLRAMQDTSATQRNPAGPERARFDALTDVIVMLEELEEGK